MSNFSITLARIALGGTTFFAVVMFIVFVFVQPELNPLYRFGSEYAVGRMGWLMKVAFYVWSAGLVAFAASIHQGLDDEACSVMGVSLVALAAVGIFLAGVWDSDLQVLNEQPPPRWIELPNSEESNLHNIASFVGLFSLMGGAGLITRRLRKAGRLRGGYRASRPISWVVPVSFAAFASFFVSY